MSTPHYVSMLSGIILGPVLCFGVVVCVWTLWFRFGKR